MAIAIASEVGAAIGGGRVLPAGIPGGAQIGAALGALLGPLLDAIMADASGEKHRSASARNTASRFPKGSRRPSRTRRTDFGGNRQAAKLFNLDRIIAEGGGLSGANIDVMFARLHDVFSAMETGAFRRGETQGSLRQELQEFADFVTRDGALAVQANSSKSSA